MIFPHMNPAARRRRLRIVIPAYPAFNIYSGIAGKTTALGPVCVGTIVNKMEGWDVEIIDENNFRRFGPMDAGGRPDHATLQRMRPADAAGFYGGLTSTIPRLYELARFYKQLGVATIAGGQHFAEENIGEALDNGIDFVVIGEGEETIKELLYALERGRSPDNVAGMAFLKDGRVFHSPERQPLAEFDKLPLPDFSLLRCARIKLFPIGWARGCGMNCEFCTVKGKVRCPAPQYVLDQVSSLVERQNAREFFIVDDLFSQHREKAMLLCEGLRQYQDAVGVRLSLTVQIRLDKAGDDELLRAMRKAGVGVVAIGFESPIQEELRAMNKKIRAEDMLAMTRRFHKAGFLVHGMFIFGYPVPEHVDFRMDAKTRVRRFKKFINKARIDTVQVLLPAPLPGTELTRRLNTESRILPREFVGWEYYDGNFPLFAPDKPLTPEETQEAIRKIMGRFYRFRHFFLVPLNIMLFPAMIFSLFNLKTGWRRWYRLWRNNLLRFGGWMIMRKWTSQLKRGCFADKLEKAKEKLHSSPQ